MPEKVEEILAREAEAAAKVKQAAEDLARQMAAEEATRAAADGSTDAPDEN
jgi:hypothetical protein